MIGTIRKKDSAKYTVIAMRALAKALGIKNYDETYKFKSSAHRRRAAEEALDHINRTCTEAEKRELLNTVDTMGYNFFEEVK